MDEEVKCSICKCDPCQCDTDDDPEFYELPQWASVCWPADQMTCAILLNELDQ